MEKAVTMIQCDREADGWDAPRKKAAFTVKQDARFRKRKAFRLWECHINRPQSSFQALENYTFMCTPLDKHQNKYFIIVKHP